MATDGKQLEALVAYVERILLPEGFQVSTNERVFNEEGVQIVEFDIEVRGGVGSTSIAWLIECRDRPTSGPAPGSWIEQLVGRRTRFGFNKVTEVSTTGFAVGAVDFAVAQGIELREVKSLAPDDFEWLEIRYLQRTERRATLLHATLLLDESEPEQARENLLELLSRVSSADAFLRSSTSSQQTTAAEAFSAAVGGIAGVFDDVVSDGPAKRVQLRAEYTDQDHFVVLTTAGELRIRAIVFEGELRILQTLVPLVSTSEYRRSEGGEVISQAASFAPQSIHGMKFSTEMHKIAETGETHIILRRLADNA